MAKIKKIRIVIKLSVRPISEKYSYIVLTNPLSGIFSPEFIRKTGSIDSNEMYRVFNMGLGMVIVCAPEKSSRILKNVPNAKLVGELKQKSSNNRVKIENKK